MYLIIEKSDSLYASFETSEHFKKAEKYRTNLTRLTPALLDDECDLEKLPHWSYLVIKVKKRSLAKLRSAYAKVCRAQRAAAEKSISAARTKTNSATKRVKTQRVK